MLVELMSRGQSVAKEGLVITVDIMCCEGIMSSYCGAILGRDDEKTNEVVRARASKDDRLLLDFANCLLVITGCVVLSWLSRCCQLAVTLV